MAYLSNTDENDQQQQGQSGQGFDAFGGGGTTGGQPQGNGGQPGGSQSLGAWIGGGSSGGQPSSSAPQSADTEAAQNAKGYQSTYAGDDNQAAKTDASVGSSGASFGAAGPQAGLSGSGQGTGYINFQNYENNAPSEAGAIAAAGQQVIGGEGTNLTNAEQPAQKTLGDVSKLATPGTDQGSVDTTVQGILTNSTGTTGTAGYASQDGLQTLNDWMNPKSIDTSVNYTPSADYTKAVPELTQTPVEGGQTTPSVLDYLAQNQIAGGGYSQGDRGLDQALISGDPNAQKAIAGNQTMNTALQNRISTEVPALQGQLANAQAGLTANAGLVNQAVTDAGTQLQANIDAATKAANANPTPQTIANENAAIKAYRDWYTSGGAQGGTWNQTGGTGTAATAVVTPEQATEANNIYLLQHPGDTAHEPYRDPNNIPGAGTASTWGGSGTSGVAPVVMSSQYDPGDAAGKSGNNGLTIGEKYTQIFTNPSYYDHAQNDLTPAEQAVLVSLHPESANFYPAPTVAALQQAAGQLEASIAAAPKVETVGGSSNSNLANKLQPYLDAVLAKIHSMQQSPYKYGISIGMTPAQLAAMGIFNGIPNLPPGTGVPGSDQIKNLK